MLRRAPSPSRGGTTEATRSSSRRSSAPTTTLRSRRSTEHRLLKSPSFASALTTYFIALRPRSPIRRSPASLKAATTTAGPATVILFAEDLTITKAHARKRIREEFDRAVAALAANKKERAAFFAGAMAHYLGDLSQFHHMMGPESHWRAEDQTLHAAYRAPWIGEWIS